MRRLELSLKDGNLHHETLERVLGVFIDRGGDLDQEASSWTEFFDKALIAFKTLPSIFEVQLFRGNLEAAAELGTKSQQRRALLARCLDSDKYNHACLGTRAVMVRVEVFACCPGAPSLATLGMRPSQIRYVPSGTTA